MKYRILLYFLFFLILAAKPQTVEAQNVAISTNAVDWLNFGTANIGVGVDVSRHFSVEAGARYNPWSFIRKSSGLAVMNRQTTAFVGVRFWPWYIFSGWWIAGKAKYEEYNRGGIFSRRTEEGDGFGVGFSAGYSYMLLPSLNLDFGIGFWTGVRKYTVYDCPSCGVTVESGTKGFILPNELLVSLVYVF